MRAFRVVWAFVCGVVGMAAALAGEWLVVLACAMVIGLLLSAAYREERQR